MHRTLAAALLALAASTTATAEPHLNLDIDYAMLLGHHGKNIADHDMWNKGAVSRLEAVLKLSSDKHCFYGKALIGHQSHLESKDWDGREEMQSTKVDYRGVGVGCSINFY